MTTDRDARHLAFHFVALVDGVPTLRDGRPVPPVGEWLEHEGPLSICNTGLHASTRAIDALEYWSGEGGAVCLVEVEDVGEEHADKFVCRRRKVIAWTPCDEWLRLFAREAALSVAQYWTMPAIVREYLEGGDETKRDAAADAAYASWAATRAAAYASWAAADAADAAAADAAYASWAATRAASWAASRAAARAAANASWAASWAAVWDAARDAAWDELNHMLESIFLDALEVDLG